LVYKSVGMAVGNPSRRSPNVASKRKLMKPAPFKYHAPTNLKDALDLLQQHADDGRVLAGGQTLVPMMNYRIAVPQALVDLNRIDSLNFIKSESGFIRIGAMTRQRDIEFSAVVARDLPLLREAVRLVGHLPTRSRGTIGGSIANADAAAELPMALQVLEGAIKVASLSGERMIAAQDVVIDPMVTSIEADEILTEVRFPVMRHGARYAIEEFSRKRGDFAVAAVAVLLEFDGIKCVKARIATAGISGKSARLPLAEQALEGAEIDEIGIAAASRAVSERVDAVSDRNGSADYRRHLGGVLTCRALRKAMLEQAKPDISPEP
jgi:carbon-monoxide dehydrogenase medium subunit